MEYNNKILLKGNEAVVYGALLANCECFFGYPITPASEVAHSAAELFPRLNRTFLQAESEIGAINMVIGAAATGKRVMTASSGLGISLKQEAMSFLAAFELPALIVDITRSGPGLGNIGPEQSDYFQLVKGGGHGHYRNLVFTPNSVQEMCDMALKAFELSEKYRIASYIMADGVIGQMMENIVLPEPLPLGEKPQWAIDNIVNGEANYFTSIFLEHDEMEIYSQKLVKKYELIHQNEQWCEEYHTADAELVLVSFGVASRVAFTAVNIMRNLGFKVGLLRPLLVSPFPTDALKKAAGHAKAFLSVELNAGQMIEDVKLAIECKRPVYLCNRMGGNITSVDQIIDCCRQILRKEVKND